MAPVRDLLALILGSVLGVVWAVHMLTRIGRAELPTEADWLVLPTGTAALLGAIYATTPRAYQARHRGE